MLDHFTIFTRSGMVLWSKSFTPAIPPSTTGSSYNHPIDSLIKLAFLEDRLSSDKYEKEGYTLQWTLANDLELVFVVIYQRILQLTYIPQLLSSIKELFLDFFKPFVLALGEATGPSGRSSLNSLFSAKKLKAEFESRLKEWEATFLKTLRSLERDAAQNNKKRGGVLAAGQRAISTASIASATNGDDSGQDTPKAIQDGKQGTTDGQDIAKNVEALRNRLKKADLKKGAKKGGSKDSPVGSGTDTPGGVTTPGKKVKAPAKEMRKWEGGRITNKDIAALDFSTQSGPGTPEVEEKGDLRGWIDEKSMGTTKDGMYEIADVDAGEEDDSSDEEEENTANGHNGTTSAAKGGFLSRFTLAPSSSSSENRSFFSRMTGNNPLTEADLASALTAMQTHLQAKNVAADVASKLCSSVSKSLVGKQVGSFGSIKAEVRKSLEEAITRILTPKSSTDILLEISTKRQKSLLPSVLATQQDNTADPYSICFVGVNGVGKSTNLAKVCFWLLQNKKRVLIAACDTFRSGAVEQLRTHVRNLGQLEVDGERVGDGTSDGKQKIELYEKGYGKDAAGIAKEALTYAKKQGFDVVLIDTAGRMQDNEPLMRALAKLVAVNSPDKIIFVGEALVGNEAVDQLTKFDRSLKDFSGVSRPRGLDGMLLTKFDTSESKAGEAKILLG
jgi:signal recognition particle receptor subunit alpha